MTQDMAERITARVDYDGEWDGQWCETGREPICIHAYHHAEYARADLLTAAEAERDEALLKVTRIHDEVEVKLAKAVEALESVMVGGNHLATILPDSFPPAETEPLIALETMGYGYDFEVWCCWRSIMLARTTLAELTGDKDG